MSEIRSICVYCGSQSGNNPAYVEAARALGASLASNDIRLVYGGGARGIMGAVAQGALLAGGKVTGVIPKFLMAKETMESWLERLDEAVLTGNMHERKHAMFERSDAFVALPGGIGTLEEIVEIMTWAQLGRHAKPIVFVNIEGFWDPMLGLLAHMRQEGFVHTGALVQPIVAEDAQSVVALVRRAAAGAAGKAGDNIERM